jgi:putative transposase
MPRKQYRPEEIIAKLREAEVLLAQGNKVPEVVKALGMHEVTYYRWRKEYSGVWEPGVREFFRDLGALIQPVKDTILGTRPSRALHRYLGSIHRCRRCYGDPTVAPYLAQAPSERQRRFPDSEQRILAPAQSRNEQRIRTPTHWHRACEPNSRRGCGYEYHAHQRR